MHLSEITTYPVKSCAGLAQGKAELDRFGLVGDRRWMIVDQHGDFLSQRRCPAMALCRVQSLSGGLQLECGGEHIEVAVPDAKARQRWVQVWGDRLMAADVGDEVAQWLSPQLGQLCRLVYMPADCQRRVDGRYASAGETVSFADGFPLLVISQASLDELNRRLTAPVPMNRFRPNLVVSGCEPFAEDRWQEISINGVVFEVAKPCSRCAIPSIDQATAQRDGQINRVLAQFRRWDGQIWFGQNLLYTGFGTLAVGDEVSVRATRS